MKVRNGEHEPDRECERRVELLSDASESAHGDPARDCARPGLGNATLFEASTCVPVRPCQAPDFDLRSVPHSFRFHAASCCFRVFEPMCNLYVSFRPT